MLPRILYQQDSCLICSPGFYCVPEEVVIHCQVTLSARRVSTAARELVETSPGALKAPFPMFLGLTTSDCQQCLGGKHCDVTNLTAPMADCDAGYFCTLGVDTSQPDGVSNTGTGGICPLEDSRCQTPESCSQALTK
ncbi:hypothetical protein MAR_036213 [Mya arenaria]|uniref:Sodefrin-like factor n=1 Tax=Mya arenaria TaxID=6604 RepID=A0ABY7EMC0_MYAAR|nr:hypothetical protein MAR_036213 [Mya arenaria]